MPTDHDESIRLECIKIAASLGIPPEKVVEKAEEFYAFITSRRESP